MICSAEILAAIREAPIAHQEVVVGVFFMSLGIPGYPGRETHYGYRVHGYDDYIYGGKLHCLNYR